MTRQIEMLRARARALLQDGTLPRTKAVRTWGGGGSGLPCELCGAAILRSEPEFEVQIDLSQSGRSLRFHRECHAVWEEARLQAQPTAEVAWISVENALPPPQILVEARVALTTARSVIMNVLYQAESTEAPQTWINATTRAPLPDGWTPIEWRPIEGSAASEPSTSSPSLSQRAR
jgi:hypothetical protein